MTFPNAIARGGGSLEFRLVIEGWPEQFVTHSDLAGSVGDGRTRVLGLVRDGLAYQEKADVPGATLQLTGMTATIIDYDKAATAAFTTEPTIVRWVDSSGTSADKVSTTDTVWNIADSSGILADRYLHAGTEVVQVSSVPSGSSIATSPTSTKRGLWNTQKQSHWINLGERLSYPEITDRPVLMKGRRAWLYAHGPSELSSTAPGSMCWHGRVGAEPRQSDTMRWQILLDPLTSILDQEINSNLSDPLHVRGIYYPWNAGLVISMVKHAGPSWSDAIDERFDNAILTGYYETQEAFISALQALIDAQTSTWFADYLDSISVVEKDNQWTIQFRTKATPGYLAIDCFSAVDGRTIRGAVLDEYGSVNTRVSGDKVYEAMWDPNSPGSELQNLFADFPDRVPDCTLARTCPRAAYWALEDWIEYTYDSAAPQARFYLERVDHLAVGDYLRIANCTAEVDVVSTSSGYVDLINPLTGERAWFLGVLLGSTGATIQASRRLEADDLAGLTERLMNDSADQAGRGTMPRIHTDIVLGDFADWNGVVDRAKAGHPHLEQRIYDITKSVKLLDLLTHEMRLYGLYLRVDASFQLDVQPIRLAAATETASFSIDSTNIEGFPTIEPNADGAINVIALSCDYDPDGAKYGRTIRYRDVRSISRLNTRRVLEIKPKARGLVEPAGSADHLAIAETVFSLFAGKYVVASVRCNATAMGVPVGSIVSLSSAVLPYGGVRGAAVSGFVTSRRVDLAKGYVDFEVLIHPMQVAGYAPCGRIVSQSGSGTGWTVTLDTRYAPNGGKEAGWFVAGDKISIMQWDSDAPIVRSGVVDTVDATANTVAVTLTASWTPGSSIWVLMGSQISVVEPSDNQQRYAWVAAADRMIDFTPNVVARKFSP